MTKEVVIAELRRVARLQRHARPPPRLLNVLIARVSLDQQHDYLTFAADFRLDSLSLDHAIARARAQVRASLPMIVSGFLGFHKGQTE